MRRQDKFTSQLAFLKFLKYPKRLLPIIINSREMHYIYKNLYKDKFLVIAKKKESAKNNQPSE